MRALVAAIVLTLILVGVAAFNTWRMYAGFRSLVSTDLRLVELRGVIVHLDEVLSMSARLSATSGDLSWEARYKKYEPLLDEAIKETIRIAPDSYTSAGAANTDAANLALVDLEHRSFELVGQRRLHDAQALVFGSEYAKQKKIYSDGMEETMASLHDRATSTTKSYADGMRASVVAALVILAFLALGWASVVRMMRGYLRERNAALDELRVANDTLEHRVQQRTSELAVSLEQLREAQDQVAATARAAGMAEVAVGVLHDVGNVLNSINVAAQMTDESLKSCRIASIRKAAAMLSAAKTDLPSFLATEKGKKLAVFLCEATTNIATSHDRASAELEHLKTGVEHVRAIVATQQAYAHASAHVETFELAELVAAAIRLRGTQSIEIVNHISAGISMTTDKHRLMQILLNLIANSCQAIAERPDAPRQIDVGAASRDGRVEIDVRDHGVGIEPETMKQLFRHGFTTKKSGHGFGLHSSANAATDLGGSIRARSDGAGLGATFVIDVPLSWADAVAGRARRSQSQMTKEIDHAA
jgi:C4-dicarboxylate-specific signal transduction histidine kinase